MKKKLQKFNYAELYTWHRKVYLRVIFTYVVLSWQCLVSLFSLVIPSQLSYYWVLL